MANDTDNNFLVTGASGDGVIATDYSSSEGSHFQVMKVAFGGVTDNPTRVNASNGLPVSIVSSNNLSFSSGNVTGTVTVSSFPSSGVTIAGGTLGIRFLQGVSTATGNGFTQGGSFGNTAIFDSIRVIGLSGAYPVTVAGTSFDIRRLSGGTVDQGYSAGSALLGDVVRVVGISGAYPVETLLFGSTASIAYGNRTALRTDTSGYLLVGLCGGVLGGTAGITVSSALDYGLGGTSINQGLQTRILRASTGGIPLVTETALEAFLASTNYSSIEDTVRVVGLSGAYPVNTLTYGRYTAGGSAISVPLNVDSSGNLSVQLAAGSIGVTANITGATFTFTGLVTLAGTSANVSTGGNRLALQVQGYDPGWTGGTLAAVPLLVTAGTANAFNIRGLSSGIDTVTVTGGVNIGNTVGITHPNLAKLTFDGNNYLSVSDTTLNTALNNLATAQAGVCGAVHVLRTTFNSTTSVIESNPSTTISTSSPAVRVAIAGIVQPSTITGGRIAVSNAAGGSQLTSFALNSGVNFKSDLSNTTATIFIGSGTGVCGGGGYPLYNGDQLFVETDNLNKIFVWSNVNGATLYYIGT